MFTRTQPVKDRDFPRYFQSKQSQMLQIPCFFVWIQIIEDEIFIQKQKLMEIKIIQMKFFVMLVGAISLYSANSLECSQGEIPDANRICVEPQFIQGCHAYKTSSSCQQCEFRYTLTEKGLCQFKEIASGPCCLEQDNEGNCKQCNKGLYLSQRGTCEQSNILGCLQKNSKGFCINCASSNTNNNSDFILTKDGKCQQGIKHCTKYVPTDSEHPKHCQTCKTGYSLINNSCLKNKILGCSKEEDHSCSECYAPFTERQNHCQIANCVTYNEYGCTHCDCGFYLTPKNVCKELEKGCLRYQRGKCTDCHSNFRLKGGSCIIEGCEKVDGLDCSKCEDEYDLVGGSCKLRNCQIWKDGHCELCDEGFRYTQGECHTVVPISAIRQDNIELA